MKIAIYTLSMKLNGGGGDKRSLVLAEGLARHHEVTLAIGGTDRVADLERYYNVDLTNVAVVRLATPWVQSLCRPVPWLGHRLPPILEPIHEPMLRRLEADIFINCTWGSTLRSPAARGVYMCMFPHGRRSADGTAFGALTRSLRRGRGMPTSTLDTYAVITANSQFTARWIRNFWQRDAEVVYSAGESMGPPGEKEKIILHVGRFVDPTRPDYKQQSVLIDAFRRMPDLIGQGWQLHFAGSCEAGATRRGFWEGVQRSAADLPVFFHENTSFEELRKLYRVAAIYWHATGFGCDAEVHPARQEHFGLTTVEAMSAGAVPVVIETGGQCETVVSGRSGFRWRTLDELAESTRLLAGDEDLRARLAAGALVDSRQFSRDSFVARVAKAGAIPFPENHP